MYVDLDTNFYVAVYMWYSKFPELSLDTNTTKILHRELYYYHQRIIKESVEIM